jgi:BirA family biotin operon repressor/biotin-[acetyl-CoA-carboxylase] ligase
MPPPVPGMARVAGELGILTAPFKLIALDEADSTNTVAKRLCVADATDRTLVWARRQTAGRGRHQRAWISPPGNLYVSLILRPRVDARQATALTFVAAVAVAEAVATLLPAGVAITCKWPNDVLVEGRKIAGILLETATAADGAVEWVIIGIGINVASHPPASETIYPATSLAGGGAAGVTVETLLEVLCPRLEFWLRRWAGEGFAVVRAAWLARAHDLGRPIAITGNRLPVRGIFRGLDGDGALVLDDGGELRRMTVGDVLPALPAVP